MITNTPLNPSALGLGDDPHSFERLLSSWKQAVHKRRKGPALASTDPAEADELALFAAAYSGGAAPEGLPPVKQAELLRLADEALGRKRNVMRFQEKLRPFGESLESNYFQHRMQVAATRIALDAEQYQQFMITSDEGRRKLLQYYGELNMRDILARMAMGEFLAQFLRSLASRFPGAQMAQMQQQVIGDVTMSGVANVAASRQHPGTGSSDRHQDVERYQRLQKAALQEQAAAAANSSPSPITISARRRMRRRFWFFAGGIGGPMITIGGAAVALA